MRKEYDFSMAKASPYTKQLKTKRKVRFSANGQFDGWRSIMFGVSLDWSVLRAGDEGVERAVELDMALGFWSFCLSWYWQVMPRRAGEHFFDALLRYDSTREHTPTKDRPDDR